VGLLLAPQHLQMGQLSPSEASAKLAARHNDGVTEHFMKTARHASFYLASGTEAGPLIIFVHGWPELSHSWRHQLRCFAALGFRCVAPDMRGYGRSSNYVAHADYALDDDMLELLAPWRPSLQPRWQLRGGGRLG
jgi:pimeloyl-ACP methyl ester carboxylesterase